MKSVSAFLYHYLVDGRSPRQIAAEHPDLAGAWSQLVGTEGELHYGRPLAFHQQAQQQDWARAWGEVKSPVLVLFGEYDWYESAASAQLIARIVERAHPGRARFVLIPRTDHHFESFASAEAAAAGTDGRENADPAVREILTWLRRTIGTPTAVAAPARSRTSP
jgi:pimeloyl-ACP methyl ester carboxylesterase